MPKHKEKLSGLKTGDIFSIKFKDGSISYGRKLSHSLLIAIYKYKDKQELQSQQIIKLPVLFKVMFSNVDDSETKWEFIVNLPLEAQLEEKVKFFIQDPVNPENIRIYNLDGREVKASPSEVKGLENAAVWYPSHMEDRIIDFFNGKPNRWVKSLALKTKEDHEKLKKKREIYSKFKKDKKLVEQNGKYYADSSVVRDIIVEFISNGFAITKLEFADKRSNIEKVIEYEKGSRDIPLLINTLENHKDLLVAISTD